MSNKNVEQYATRIEEYNRLFEERVTTAANEATKIIGDWRYSENYRFKKKQEIMKQLVAEGENISKIFRETVSKFCDDFKIHAHLSIGFRVISTCPRFTRTDTQYMRNSLPLYSTTSPMWGYSPSSSDSKNFILKVESGTNPPESNSTASCPSAIIAFISRPRQTTGCENEEKISTNVDLISLKKPIQIWALSILL